MEETWSMAEQIGRSLGWESRKLFYRMRLPAGVILSMLLIIGLLPEKICNFLSSQCIFVAAFVNACFASAFIAGILFWPDAFLAAAYTDRMHFMEKTGDLSEKARLSARLLLCMAWMAVLVLGEYLASGLMGKFATESVRWFRIDFELGYWKQIVLGGLVQPLLFLWCFLSRLGMGQKRQYVWCYFVSVVCCQVLDAAAGLQFVHFAPKDELPAWVMDGVWYLVMFGFSAVLLRRVLGRIRNASKAGKYW